MGFAAVYVSQTLLRRILWLDDCWCNRFPTLTPITTLVKCNGFEIMIDTVLFLTGTCLSGLRNKVLALGVGPRTELVQGKPVLPFSDSSPYSLRVWRCTVEAVSDVLFFRDVALCPSVPWAPLTIFASPSRSGTVANATHASLRSSLSSQSSSKMIINHCYYQPLLIAKFLLLINHYKPRLLGTVICRYHWPLMSGSLTTGSIGQKPSSVMMNQGVQAACFAPANPH